MIVLEVSAACDTIDQDSFLVLRSGTGTGHFSLERSQEVGSGGRFLAWVIVIPSAVLFNLHSISG